jgi:putative membrane protein
MPARIVIARWQTFLLAAALFFYLVARVSQLYADRLPTLAIVILHVLSPAVFAMIHGSILYRVRGMLTFAALCLGIGGLCESLSLRTGFPFGHYYFTEVMGPKVFQLPVLLVLAYLGMGYISWVISLAILGYRDQPLTGTRVVAVPVLASFVMLAWDLSMEAVWANVDRAWIWRDGGAFFGVPVSNFFGWYLTAFLFYQAFALYCQSRPMPPPHLARSYWRAAVLFYGLCALGNLLVLRMPTVPSVVTDASGKHWRTSDILAVVALHSLLVMFPMALLAWLRINKQEA